MLSVDTNVVIRLLVNDDRTQAKKARDLLIKNDFFLSKTVILECFWVLTYAYDINTNQALESLLKFSSLNNVILENQTSIFQAIELAQNGLDFADALHLTSSAHSDKLVTFDKKFIKKAKKLNTEPPVSSL